MAATAAASDARLRLFVAVDVPAEVREALDRALLDLRHRAPQARWVPQERWHLTLAFLGHLDARRLPDVEEALCAAAGRGHGFDLGLTGALGRFGGRVLYAELTASDGLARLAAAVRAELVARDLPADDRPFRAHLTIARAPGRGRLPQGLGTDFDGPTASWHVGSLALVRSRLAPGGAQYTTLASWPIGPPAGS